MCISSSHEDTETQTDNPGSGGPGPAFPFGPVRKETKDGVNQKQGELQDALPSSADTSLPEMATALMMLSLQTNKLQWES